MDYCFSKVVKCPFNLKWSGVKCLARKVTNEFDETKEEGRDLEHRFPGKDSRLFCHKFIRLKFLSCEGDSRKQRLTFLVYARLCFTFRSFTHEQIQELAKKSQKHFRVNSLLVHSTRKISQAVVYRATRQLKYSHGTQPVNRHMVRTNRTTQQGTRDP